MSRTCRRRSSRTTSERAVDALQERLSVRVQPDLPTGPVEERDAELGFEALDRPAERGLVDSKLLRRPRHVLRAGQGLELSELREVHGS